MPQTCSQKLLIDICSGRWGLSKAFAVRGWRCIGIDLTPPPEIPDGCEFVQADLRELLFHEGVVWLKRGFEDWTWRPDFLWASTPCENFSVHAMKHFHPDPPYPTLGIELFNHVRAGFEATKLPWVMENVRAAQQFVGNAVHHCGPFYLWGPGVPPLLHRGITKSVHALQMAGGSLSGSAFNRLSAEEKRAYRNKSPWQNANSKSPQRQKWTAQVATIPPELATCVAAYAERLLEQRAEQRPLHREAAK